MTGLPTPAQALDLCPVDDLRVSGCGVRRRVETSSFVPS
jgi:hypothetical protein